MMEVAREVPGLRMSLDWVHCRIGLFKRRQTTQSEASDGFTKCRLPRGNRVFTRSS